MLKVKGNCSDIQIELFPIIIIPLMYGLAGIINYIIIKKYGINYSLVTGMLFGLILSSIGRFALDLPIKLFNFTVQNDYLVHIYICDDFLRLII